MKLITFSTLRTEKLDGRARSTIYDDIKNGRLPRPIKLGGKLYWEEGEVDNRLNAQRMNDLNDWFNSQRAEADQ
jgi:prophage regulatory protein